ncbi:phage tail protein I [Campylobacter hyointestinalis]|uniref:phage tail protein I n=1 Tax=Campylobacter hyointestinalis TaxID=198 RepID=UPI000CE47560|nr:phage tail protein I [Campylobacter hyointestinalis]PPB54987.1 phage tail protein I [Campylobacter hyointestinalis subsp. hyointestinalis]
MSLLPNHKSKFDKKIDELFGIGLDSLDISVIDTLSSSCPKQLLPVLAASFDVDIDTLSEVAAHELIKNAFEIHYYSGTFYSLQKALSSFFDTAKVYEWFSYGGKPYHFKLELEASNQGIDKESLIKMDKIVNAYKNVRSVYDGVTIKISSKANTLAGAYLIQGESIEVYPFVLREINANGGYFVANTIKQDEIIGLNLNLKGVVA